MQAITFQKIMNSINSRTYVLNPNTRLVWKLKRKSKAEMKAINFTQSLILNSTKAEKVDDDTVSNNETHNNRGFF